MVEKGIRGGISHTIHQYVKANVKQMKNYNKARELSYLKYWDVQCLRMRNVAKVTCRWF